MQCMFSGLAEHWLSWADLENPSSGGYVQWAVGLQAFLWGWRFLVLESDGRWNREQWEAHVLGSLFPEWRIMSAHTLHQHMQLAFSRANRKTNGSIEKKNFRALSPLPFLPSHFLGPWVLFSSCLLPSILHPCIKAVLLLLSGLIWNGRESVF